MKSLRLSVTDTNTTNARFLHSLPLLIVFFSEVFFAIFALFGFSYEGSENSSSYRMYIAILVVVTVALASRWILSGGLRVRHFFLLFLLALIILAFFLNVALGRSEAQSWSSFSFWAIVCIPAYLAGIAAAKSQQLKNASLIFEPLMLLFSAAAIIYSVGNFTSGLQTTGLGGATYQTASYMSALAFGLNLYHLLFGGNHNRWAFAKNRLYTTLSIALVPVQVVACLLTGGRGGFVLIVVYVAALVLVSMLNRRRSKLGLGLSALTLLTLVVFLMLPNLLSSEYGARIIGRVFAYVGSDGIDWEGTSGRDTVYEQAWVAFRESPIMGYGVFSWGIGSYPHNLFLEILLNGGILYLAVAITVLLFVTVRIFRRSQSEPECLILITIGLFAFVMLMFSGSYWLTSSFWYVLGAATSWQLVPRVSSPIKSSDRISSVTTEVTRISDRG